MADIPPPTLTPSSQPKLLKPWHPLNPDTPLTSFHLRWLLTTWLVHRSWTSREMPGIIISSSSTDALLIPEPHLWAGLTPGLQPGLQPEGAKAEERQTGCLCSCVPDWLLHLLRSLRPCTCCTPTAQCPDCQSGVCVVRECAVESSRSYMMKQFKKITVELIWS